MAESGFFDALADEASQEDFLRRELAGSAPQYDPEGGLNTAKNIGRMAAEMTIPGAAASAAGYMGEPSMFQNIGSGDYGTAALQAAGLIPGIGWMGKAGRLGKSARRASEVIPPSAAREVGATPRGWDIAGPREAGRTIEGNVAVEPYLIGGEGAPAPRRAVNYTSEVPLPRYTDYGPKISTELNPQIADLLRSIRAEGRAPNRFESNMLSSYFRGQQGSAAAEAMANMPVSVIPRGVQRALNNIRAEGREPTKLELLNMKKHFAGRTGLKSRAALDRVSMGEELAGPYPEFRGAIREEMAAAPEELAASEGTRESLINRALNIASRVGPRVAEGMAVGAPAGMATGLAYNAMMDRGEMPVVPIANREESPVIAPMQLREFPMSTAMGTDFESVPSVASDMPQEAALPPRRPMGISRSGEAPVRRPSAPRHAAPIHRSAPRHAGPSRMVDSGKRYYGDWRDAEPYASDPIGGFIDELTGRTRTARRPGRAAPSSAGLGDLLPFASGGTVRRPFANGGAEDRIPVLSDIGDALGGMMQGGEEPVVASDRSAAPEGRENIFERWSNNPLSQYLFAAGLGMMASPQANPLMAVGEGGLRGLEYMQAVQANSDMRRREKQAAAERRQQLEFLKNLDQPQDAVASDVAPSKSSLEEPETVIPETQTSQDVKPETIKTTQSEQKTAINAPPVVAQDNRLEQLSNLNQKILRSMPYVTDPSVRSGLVARQKSLEAEMNRIQRQREKAVEDARIQRGLQLQEKRIKIEEEAKDPTKVFERTAEETAGKTQDKRIQDIDQSAVVADQTLDQIKEVQNAYKAGDIHTSPYVQTFLKGVQGLGLEFAPSLTNAIVSPSAIKNTEILMQLGVSDLMKKIGGSLGTGISEGDRRLIEQQALGIDKSPEANIKALKNLEKVMNRAIEVKNFKDKYIKKYGRLDKDFEASLSQHFEGRSLGLDKTSKTQRPEGLSDEDIRKEIERRRGAGG